MTQTATAWALTVLGMSLACCHLSTAAPTPKNTSVATAASASSGSSNS